MMLAYHRFYEIREILTIGKPNSLEDDDDDDNMDHEFFKRKKELSA